MTTFGITLKELRQKAGVSQRALATSVGLDFSYISKVENDRLPPPAADTIVAICRVLQAEPDELLALIGKLPTEVQKVISSNKAAQAFLREAQRMELSEDKWKTLTSTIQEGTKKFRILITDALSPQSLEMLRAATDVTFDVVESPSQDDLEARVAGYDALLIRSSVKITARVLANAENLKVIGRAGVGLDNVDISEASRRGVIVMNTPDANTITTCEHTLALMFALCRNLPQAHRTVVDGGWNRSKFMGIQLFGKTLGIFGLGRIGRQVAKRALALGMNIIGVDPYISEEVARENHITLVSRDELFAQSDFITLHTVLTPETRGMINAESIAKMKPGIRIINAARGELINEEALIEALKSGQVAGAALDTYAQEPLAANSELRGLPNVVLTPHIAASTVEAQLDAGYQVVEQVLDALRGKDFKNAVNMPIADAKVFQEMKPYLQLAERLGSLQMQLAEQPLTQVEVEVQGEDIGEQSKLMTIATIKGILDAITDQPVNYINTLHLARERGIRVTETQGKKVSTRSRYANQIICRAVWNGGERLVIGSLLGEEAPRLVQLDEFRLDTQLEGILLVIGNMDKPGAISRVSSLLAANNINIAEWRLGRRAPGEQALSFVNLDSPASENVLNEIKQLEGIVSLKQIYL